MIELFTPVAIALIAILIADTSGIMDKIKYWITRRIADRLRSDTKIPRYVPGHIIDRVSNYEPFRIKPFDCSLCLSFWFSIAWCIIDGKSFELFIFTTGCATYLSILLTKFIMK